MIKLDTYKSSQEIIGYLAKQFDFPNEDNFRFEMSTDVINNDNFAYQELLEFQKEIYHYNWTEIKEVYTQTFDFNKKAPLFMTYNKFDTQKERGQLLAKLKVLYEMFGLKMVDNELSDYLPLMLEFLYIADWENDPRAENNIEFVIMVIEDGTYAMMKHLSEINSPYYHLVYALRIILKSCLHSSEGVTKNG